MQLSENIRKVSLTSLETRAENVVRNYVALRAGKMCEWTGTGRKHCRVFDWVHIIGRGENTTKFHPLNSLYLCHDCHMYAHAHIQEFYDWLDYKYPGRLDMLRQLATQVTKFDADYLQNVIDSTNELLLSLTY